MTRTDIYWADKGYYFYSQSGYWRYLGIYAPYDVGEARYFDAVPDGWEDVSDPEVKRQAAEEAARRAGRD